MHNFSKTLKKSIEPVVFCLLLAVACLLCADKRYSVAVTDGISLYVASVLPALFPYFFITAMLSRLKFTSKISKALSPFTTRTFNANGLVGYAFVMSVISGYPIGAKLTADLYENGLISKTEAVRASAFCSTPSPTFLIASVGGLMFNDTKFGLMLFLTCLTSSLIVGFAFSFYRRKDKPLPTLSLNAPNSDNIIYESNYSAVISAFTVGGLITLFTVLIRILCSLKLLAPLEYAITFLTGSKQTATGISLGLIECTNGLKRLSLGGINFFTLPVVAMLCGFGGLCIITQSATYLKKTKINTAVFILAKLITAVICFIVGCLFSVFL